MVSVFVSGCCAIKKKYSRKNNSRKLCFCFCWWENTINSVFSKHTRRKNKTYFFVPIPSSDFFHWLSLHTSFDISLHSNTYMSITLRPSNNSCKQFFCRHVCVCVWVCWKSSNSIQTVIELRKLFKQDITLSAVIKMIATDKSTYRWVVKCLLQQPD